MSPGARHQGDAKAAGAASMRGREADVRDVLALLDGHRMVVLAAGRGLGKTMLLGAIASRYGVSMHQGAPPAKIARGDLVVVDDADALARDLLASLVKRTQAQHGRLLLSVRDRRAAPRGAAVHRLGALSFPDSLALLGLGEKRAFSADELVDRIGGHPWLLVTTCCILRDRRAPRSLKGVLDRLGKATWSTWLAHLPSAERRAAARLVAAGGCLPAPDPRKGFSKALDALVSAGLADKDEEWVTAGALLSAAPLEAPSPKVLSSMLSDLAGNPEGKSPMGLLARSHLLHRLGRDDEALQAQREGYRLGRGTARGEAYERSLSLLASTATRFLQGSARLALEAQRALLRLRPAEAAAAVSALMESGALIAEEALEARTFIAWLRMGLGKGERAGRELAAVASDAASQGNLYAEAQALLWQAWLEGRRDEPRLSRDLAKRAIGLAAAADAPVLQERALFCLARGEINQGSFDAAGRHLEKALRVCRRHRLNDDQTVVLDALAELAGRVGRPSEAAAHLDAADALIAVTGNLPRRAELAVTRAEVAMLRGHVATAGRILSSASLKVMEDGWRRDLLAAEAALASGDLVAARSGLADMASPPAPSRDWRRRRAGIAAGLLEEGVEPKLDLTDVFQDPAAALRLERALGDLESAEKRVGLLAKIGDDDPDGRIILRFESAHLRLRRGEIEEASADLAGLRELLVQRGPPTALILLLEALDHILRNEPYPAALRAVTAHRSARALGNERLAALCLECLVAAHLALGRLRGLGPVLGRAARQAELAGSPARAARIAGWRLAASIRSGGAPARADLDQARLTRDPVVAAFVDLLVPESAAGSSRSMREEPLAGWLRSLVLKGAVEGAPQADASDLASVELQLDGDKREAILAGGKRVCFQRRRVLFRLLWKILEAGQGAPIDPEPLYRAAWELPFNPRRLNSLYVGIRRLRLLVEPDPSSPRIILAASRGGYYADPRRVRARGASPLEE